MMAAEPALASSMKLDVAQQGKLHSVLCLRLICLSGPDASIEPFAAKALNSYKSHKQGELSFKKVRSAHSEAEL